MTASAGLKLTGYAPTIENVLVQDNGVGFDCNQAQGTGALGIMGMREHMHSCGGEVTIRSARNKGTAVRIRIPCGPKA